MFAVEESEQRKRGSRREAGRPIPIGARRAAAEPMGPNFDSYLDSISAKKRGQPISAQRYPPSRQA